MLSPNHESTPEHWYKDGLQFECTGCGNCCTGEPGYVWVTEQEIQSLADLTGTELEAFTETYVRKIGARFSLREFPNGDCVFFDSDKRNCTVYDARPVQCKTWPFWNSNLETPEDWQRTCQECPGSGRGPLVPIDDIEHQRKQINI